MFLDKLIEIDGLPLSFHKVATAEIDIDLAVIRLTIRSWFNKAAYDTGTPPHRVHFLVSHALPEELGPVLQRALQAGPLEDALIVMPALQQEAPAPEEGA